MQLKRLTHRRTASVAFLLAWTLLQFPCAGAQQLPAAIQYELDATRSAAHVLHVTMRVPSTDPEAADIAVPAWSPGYYQILDFRRDIHNMRAASMDGRALDLQQTGPLTWRVSGKGPFRLDYDVDAAEAGFGFFRCHADARTAYVNGSAAFLYLPAERDRPCVLTVHMPTGWKIAAPLNPAETAQSTPEGVVARFRAPNYEALIDAPIQMGALEQIDFTVRGVPFSIALVGQSPVDRKALQDTVQRIAAAGMRLFGSVPFSRYVLVVHFAVGSFGGGLEHRASAVLNVPSSPQDPVHPWASLIAHEYFHAWNVKRIRPAGLGPFDLSKEVRTPSLWFAEGVTDYYSQVLLRMANITTPEDFLADMARRIKSFEANPAHLLISAEEASRRAWEGGSMGYGGLDYYIAGSVLGFMLDIEIRSATAGRHSLDDVMRWMDRRYGAANRAYPEGAILEAVNAVAGTDFSALYNRTIRAPGRIDWNEVLARAGLVMGGPGHVEPFLGIACPVDEGSGAVVEAVEPGSPAAEAGIQPGDVIAAIDSVPVNAANVRDVAGRLRPGGAAVLTVQRGSGEVRITVRVASRRTDGRLALIPDVDPLVARIRKELLRIEAAGAVGSPPAQIPTQGSAH